MTVVVTQLEGPDVLEEPKTFGAHDEITFGRSRSNEIAFPWSCETVGSHDIKIVQSGPRYAKIERRGAGHYLAVNGKPIPDDAALPILKSGDTVRLGGSDGPSFRIDVEGQPHGENVTPLTEEGEVIDSYSDRLKKIGMALAAIVVVFGTALGGYAVYDQVYLPWRVAQNQEWVASNTYLVVEKGDGAMGKAYATAFVVGDDTLATNAHVTEGIKKNPENFFVLNAKGERYPIVSVTSHPAYTAFKQEKWNLGEITPEGFKRLALPSAYDVGVIKVDASEPLSDRPLEVAEQEDLKSLKKGEDLISAGFPSEGLVGEDIATMGNASAKVSEGLLRDVQDIFRLGEGTEEHGLLLTHDLPVAGGISGSPVADPETGLIVAIISGGNTARIKDQAAGMNDKGQRVERAAMVNFAQRADLLNELMEGTASARLSDFKAYWAATGEKFSQYNDYIGDVFVDHVEDEYDVSAVEPVVLNAGSLRTAADAQGKRSAKSIKFEAEPGYIYGLLAVLSGDAGSFARTGMSVWQNGQAIRSNDSLMSSENAAVTWRAKEMPAAFVRVSEPSKLEIKLTGFLKGPVTYELELYKWPVPAVEQATDAATQNLQQPPAEPSP